MKCFVVVVNISIHLCNDAGEIAAPGGRAQNRLADSLSRPRDRSRMVHLISRGLTRPRDGSSLAARRRVCASARRRPGSVVVVLIAAGCRALDGCAPGGSVRRNREPEVAGGVRPARAHGSDIHP